MVFQGDGSCAIAVPRPTDRTSIPPKSYCGFPEMHQLREGRSGRIKLSADARWQFRRDNPCPATGETTGACPGFHIDHRVPSSQPLPRPSSTASTRRRTRGADWRTWGRGGQRAALAELEAPERLELSTFPLGTGRSFLLSYGAVEPQAGFEPT